MKSLRAALRASRLIVMACALILLSVLLGSLGALATAPRLGVTVTWHDDLQAGVIEAVPPGSALARGDRLLGIGDVALGYWHLLRDNIHISQRNHLREWMDAKRELYAAMVGRESVPVLIERDGARLLLEVPLDKAGLGFLGRVETLHLLFALCFFLIGAMVLYNQRGSQEAARVFFALCVSMSLVYLSNATTLLMELVLPPTYVELLNLVNVVSFFLAPALLLHFALIVPRRRRFIVRFPWLQVVYYSAYTVIGLLLAIPVINIAVPVLFLCSVAAVVQGFFSYRTPIERQQMKWVAAGFGASIVPWIVINGVPLLLFGERLINDTLPGILLILLPIFLGLAVRKSRLIDVDELFEGTFVYLLTFGVLALVELAFLGFLSSSFTENAGIYGIQPTVQVLLAGVLLLTLYAPVHARIRYLVQRAFRRVPPDEVLLMTRLIDQATGQAPHAVLTVLAHLIHDGFGPRPLALREGEDLTEPLRSLVESSKGVVALWEHGEQTIEPEFLLALPLDHGGRVEAVLLLGEPARSRMYSRTDLKVLEALLKQVRILYANAHLFAQQAQQREELLRRQQQELLDREAIMRDLHDGLGGLASRIALLAETGQNAATPTEAQRSLAQVSVLARESLDEMRGLLSTLDAREAGWEELVATLRDEANRALVPHGVAVEFAGGARPDATPPTGEHCLALRRILREALTNVVKHAAATAVRIQLEVGPERVLLTVNDNGKGLGGAPPVGRGLGSMRSRARQLGGQLSFAGPPGTTVSLTLPLERQSV